MNREEILSEIEETKKDIKRYKDLVYYREACISNAKNIFKIIKRKIIRFERCR